jgi:hypothetical protein
MMTFATAIYSPFAKVGSNLRFNPTRYSGLRPPARAG